MSSLFRPNIATYQLPDGRHRTSDGKRVTKSTPGAVKVVRRSSVWWGKYKDTEGSFIKVALCGNKTASKEMLDKLATDAKMAQLGMGNPFAKTHDKPLLEHLEDYRRYLEGEGNAQEYVTKTCANIRKILDGCEFVFIADLMPEKIVELLHRLRRDPPRPTLPPGKELFTPREMIEALGGRRPPQLARILKRESLVATGEGKARRYPRTTVEVLQERVLRGIGISTSNGYLTAVKGFSRWLMENERTDRDRLTRISRLNSKTDRRHERRALPEAGLKAILGAAGRSEVQFGNLAGCDRRILYAVAMTTGFRASELASLSPSSFTLESQTPTVTVKAGYSKNRRESVQPLPADVAEVLRAYLVGKPRDRAVWPGDWNERAAEMLRIDLDLAGIAYRDDDDRVFDFHGLRHSFVTLLEQSGASPKMAQELARHSDIRMTMNTYTHIQIFDKADAVAGLPLLLTPSLKNEAIAGTGTDGAPVPRLDQTPDRSSFRLISNDSEERIGGVHPLTRKSSNTKGFDSECDRLIADDGKLPRMDSNHDKENQNLLCYRYTTG